jgi:hypothetical protein
MKRIGAIAASLAITASSAKAIETALWPSQLVSLNAQSDTTAVSLPDGWVGVATGNAEDWPGVRLDFNSGTMDLTEFTGLAVTLSNTTDRAESVSLSVKCESIQGRMPGGSIKLEPHAAGVLKVKLRSMPWILDSPLEIEGMRGYPSVSGDTIFDVRKVHSIHIFFHRPKEPGGFAVGRAVLTKGSLPRKVLKAEGFFPFVDRFGQFKHDDWPGKVKSETELERSRLAEERELAVNGSSPIPDCDRYGGWAGGPKLKATGFFRTEKIGEKWWFVDPEGHLFFSHGVNAVGADGRTGITHREKYFEWIPARDDKMFARFFARITRPQAQGFYKDAAHLPYSAFDFSRANMLRKYGENWERISAMRSHERLRAWGLNTIANWSSPDVTSLRLTPYTIALSTRSAPRLKDSKGWWGALPDPFAAEFEAGLRERARQAAARMRDDPWCLGVFVDNELSWNGEARMAEVAEQYFAVVSRVLKEELPNHLYLGSRIAWGSPAVYRACSRHADVVSVNFYDRQPGRNLPDGCVDKPMLVGEFHFGALDRGMFHTGLVATGSQDERAECYRKYVNACLEQPRYIGVHWFQWKDQPLTGRGDGENYQIGFLNVVDSPYPELVAAAKQVAAGMYSLRFSSSSSPR